MPKSILVGFSQQVSKKTKNISSSHFPVSAIVSRVVKNIFKYISEEKYFMNMAPSKIVILTVKKYIYPILATTL